MPVKFKAVNAIVDHLFGPFEYNGMTGITWGGPHEIGW